MTWTDYEVTIPITIYGIDSGGFLGQVLIPVWVSYCDGWGIMIGMDHSQGGAIHRLGVDHGIILRKVAVVQWG